MRFKNPIFSIPCYDYNKEYYSTLGTKEGILKKVKEVMRFVGLKEGMNVLGIGTGRGELAIEYPRKGYWVKAIDFISQATELAKENLQESDFAMTRPGFWNDLFARVFSFERHFMGRIRFPLGVSIIIVAEKKL